MAKKTSVKTPRPQYTFAINPYSDVRFSKCPKCSRPTHLRKFPLFIHIENAGGVALGKTCRYCSRCEFIIVHQDELEDELVHLFSARAPHLAGSPYMVLGTLDKKVWQQHLHAPAADGEQLLITRFKNYVTLEYEPGGWQYDGDT